MAYMNGKKILQLVINNGGSESSTLITTTTDATLVSGSTYELALTYLAETPKINDFIAYVDNGSITTLYKVTAVDSTNATLTKIGDIGGGGGGKQLYQHILKISITGIANQYVSITNDSNDAFDFTALKNYLNTNNFSSGLYLPVVSSNDGTGVGLYYDGGSSIYLKTTTGQTAFGNASISDRRIPL